MFFCFVLLNLLPKIIIQFQNLAASSVQKLILFSDFMISDVMMIYPKTKRYLYLQKKNIKKAQGIIFHGVKTGKA